MVGAGLHSPGVCWEARLKKPNQQLSPFHSSANSIAFNFFKCLVPVHVFPSHCYKWGLLLSTATRLLGLERKQSHPDAAGTGGPGKVMSSPPLIPLQRRSHWYHSRFLPARCASPSTATASLPFGDKLRGSKLCPLNYTLLAGYCVCGGNAGC